eukprot:TRINITY_DN8562_c0_g1_i1.p1 TRINITY_DN8562_c0_g1~~TRINITY_DN8562_c0_g1_i1.p1  ORF type:complete len:269 (-),score=100.17 TRINITY_DN8562_c0_g1_i1:117-923(-)
MSNSWKLDGCFALVTGGTKGIGLACAQELLQLGASVLVVARDQQTIDKVVSDLNSQYPSKIHGYSADLSDSRSRKELVAHLSTLCHGRLDILVNNVGTNIRKRAIDMSEDEYRKVLSTNLDSYFMLSILCHALLKKSGRGSVVNISSVAGINALWTGSVYGMSKAAIHQLTKNLSCEWAEDSIRVNCIAPWYIDTPLVEKILSDKAYHQAVVDRTPLRRVGKPSEIAGLVAFLCMEKASYITGQIIAVDGGYSAYGLWWSPDAFNAKL